MQRKKAAPTIELEILTEAEKRTLGQLGRISVLAIDEALPASSSLGSEVFVTLQRDIQGL